MLPQLSCPLYFYSTQLPTVPEYAYMDPHACPAVPAMWISLPLSSQQSLVTAQSQINSLQNVPALPVPELCSTIPHWLLQLEYIARAMESDNHLSGWSPPDHVIFCKMYNLPRLLLPQIHNGNNYLETGTILLWYAWNGNSVWQSTEGTTQTEAITDNSYYCLPGVVIGTQ